MFYVRLCVQSDSMSVKSDCFGLVPGDDNAWETAYHPAPGWKRPFNRRGCHARDAVLQPKLGQSGLTSLFYLIQ